MFDVEDKIKWNDLAKSLQDIIMRKIGYDDLDKSLKDKLVSSADSAILADVFANGYDGQVLKVNATKGILFADDNYRTLKVVSTDAELSDEMSFKPVSLKDVFNTWYRYAHSDNHALSELVTNPDEYSFGTWQNKGYLDIWSYDETNNCINDNADVSPVCGFISPTNFYTNYYLRIRYNTGDDDNTFIVVGYMKDSAGVEHTLSIFRGSHSDTICYWALIYDAGNATQHKIVDYTDKVGSQPGGTFYISAKRVNNSLEFKTSMVNNPVDNESWTINWSYPDKKPVDMTQSEYDNIGVMLNQTNRVGFGVRSMRATFYIDKQYEIFDDGDIYAMHQDKVYSFNIKSGEWEVKGKMYELLPDKIFLYNTRLEKLYFYKFWNNYQLIEAY